MSLACTYQSVLPEARVLSISLGRPNGRDRMAWVTICVPPAPPMPMTASMRPWRYRSRTRASSRSETTAMASPRRRARMLSGLWGPAPHSSANPMSAAQAGGVPTPTSTVKHATPHVQNVILDELGFERPWCRTSRRKQRSVSCRSFLLLSHAGNGVAP